MLTLHGMLKVLILCTGNGTRSQMAEAYFNFYAHNEGVFFSAGIESSDISPNAITVMAEDNLDLSEQLSKSLQAFKDIHFDHVITVCEEANEFLDKQLLFSQRHHHPMPNPETKEEDPVVTLELFRTTRDLIKVMVLKFIGQKLLQESENIPFA